jgi:cytoskeleton protein RodZ
LTGPHEPRELTGSDGPDSAGRRTGRQPPWEKSPEHEPGSFGAWLRRQREMREISLRDVAERTKISIRYLEAMEDDRFDALPAPVFAKGFLREYARYVGLSPDEVVNHYLASHKPAEDAETGDIPVVERRPRRNWTYSLFLVLAGLLLLAAVALLAYWAERHRDRGQDSRAAPSIAAPPLAAPVAAAVASGPQASPAAGSGGEAPPPPAAEAQAAPLELTLDFTQQCWVEALIDGETKFEELRVQGESLQIPAQESIVLTLGNASAVEAHVNGLAFPLPSDGSQVVRDLRIDLQTVQSLRDQNGAI